MKILFAFLALAFRRPRGRAANEAADRSTATLYAANARALEDYAGDTPPAEEWLQISPYGEFDHPNGRQIVNRAAANAMVTSFNSLVSRAGNFFRGVPIYVGHPDLDPQRWPDDRRIGKVKDLAARDDGFYGLVAWNDLGQRNRAQGYHVYPSPFWFFPKRLLPEVHPDQLISIGMTNTPNITEVGPWTANSKTQTQETEMKREDIIRMLGLAANATDAEIETALRGAAANTTALTTANGRVTTLEGDLQTERTRATDLQTRLTAANAAHAKTLIDAAIGEGRLTAAERPAHESAFTTDFAAASNALAALPKKLSTTEIELGGDRRSIATKEERMAIVNSAVAAYQTQNPNADHATAWNAVSRDPKYAAVFQAMDGKTGDGK